MLNFLEKNYFEIATTIIGAAWILYLFFIKRERFPKVEFNLDLKIIEKTSTNLIIEFIAIIENKGTVRHKIDLNSFILKIRFLTRENLVELSNETQIPYKFRNGKETKIDFFTLNFPQSIKPNKTKEIYWLPKELGYTFIDAGTIQKLSLPISIPIEAKILLITSKFKYKDYQSEFHSAQSIFNLEKVGQ